MELARTHVLVAKERGIPGAWTSWLLLGVMLIVGWLLPAAAAQAAPSPDCPILSYTVPYGGSQTQYVGYCDGGTFVGVGPVKVPPQHGTVSFDVFSENVTYTHNGTGADLTDQFVIDDSNGGDITINVTIQPPASAITISPGALTGLKVGVPYSQQLSASGGDGNYTYAVTAGSIPGLTLSPSGLLSGTPSSRATTSITVQVTDGTNETTSKTYSASPANPTITVNPLTGAALGVPYTRQVTASGGIAPYTIVYNSGTTPPGTAMSGSVLSGTPTAVGTYSFQVQVTDSSGGTFPYSVALPASATVVTPPTITIAPTLVTSGVVGMAYSQTITATGGTAPYTYAVSAGALPLGVTFNTASGTLSGTPTEAGFFSFTISATDADTFVGTRSYTMLVGQPVILIAPTSANVSTGTGELFNLPFSASGGLAPYTYAITTGTLPAGVTLTAQGVLGGTPTKSGSFPLQLTVTSSGTGVGAPFTQSHYFVLTVEPPTITFNGATLAQATQDASYTASVTAASGGIAPYTYTTPAGGLPPGILLNATTGAFSGTPTTPGTYSFTVRATDSTTGTGPYAADATYSITVASAAPVANDSSLVVSYGAGPTNVPLSLSGGVVDSLTITTAPTHGILDVTGTSVTYTPASNYGGPDNFSYTATNVAGTSSVATVSITVSGPTLSMTFSGLTGIKVGTPATIVGTFAGGTEPYSDITVTGLPAGLAMTSTGNRSVTITGTPTESGAFMLIVNARDASVGNGPYPIHSNEPLSVAPATLSPTVPAGIFSVQYGQQLDLEFPVTGGIAPYTYTFLGTLPAGVSVDGGWLRGVPTQVGLYTVTVTAEDSSTGASSPATLTTSYSLYVSPPTISVGPALAPLASAGTAYGAQFTASGGIAPYSFAVTNGALPAGVALQADGSTIGAPTASGTFSFTITTTDANGQTGARAYTLTVAAPTLTLSPAAGALPGATAATAYSQTFVATGGTPAHTYSLGSGALPDGLTLSSNGVLSGTPTRSGAFNFTLTAVDSTSGTAGSVTESYSLVVAAPTLAVTPLVLVDGTASSSYTQTLSASGGIAPYGFTLVAGRLPDGITLSPTGDLSGTSTEAGSFSFTVRVEDSTSGSPGVLLQPYTLQIAAPTLTLSPAAGALPSGTSGTAYSQNLSAAGGQAPYAYAIASGTLPGGVTLSAGGVLSGTPTSSGTFSFSVRATDSTGGTAGEIVESYTLGVVPGALSIAPPAGMLPPAMAALTYTQALTASGGVAPYTFSLVAGALPAGITLAADGTLSGVPTAEGSFNLIIEARDSTTGTAALAIQPYILSVGAPALAVTPAAGPLPAGVAGAAYQLDLVGSGGNAPYDFSVVGGAFPSGLTLSPTGTVSGVSTASGIFLVNVQMRDSTTDGTAFINTTYTLSMGTPTLSVAPAAGPLPAAAAGTAYQQTVTASGGVAPYVYEVLSGALPAGLTLDTAGNLSGTPTESGTFNFTVRASDSTSGGVAQIDVSYVLQVSAPTLVLAPAAGALQAGTAATAYQQSFTTTGGIAPYSYSIASGALPSGLTLDTGGNLSGTPTASGTFAFSVQVMDTTTGTPAALSQAYTLTIAAPTLSLAPATGALPGGTAGAAYSQTFTATDGVAPYTYAITAGALPAGVTLSTGGVLSGTPTVAGSFAFTVQATDSTNGTQAMIVQAYTLEIAAPTLTLSPVAGPLPLATVGAGYTQTFIADGGQAPYAYALTAGTLPTGITLAADGTLSGTAQVAGNFSFTVQATDSTGGSPATISQAYTLQVVPPTLLLAPAAGALPPAVSGVVYAQTFSTTGGAAPYIYAVAAGALPAGLTLSAAGELEGTPTAAGTFNFTVQVSDSTVGGVGMQSQAYTLAVSSGTLVLAPTAGALPGAVAGTSYQQDFTVTGGVAPYSHSVTAGALPAGLTLSAGGTLSGTPTSSGTFIFTITAVDSTTGTPAQVSQSYTLQVAAPTLLLVPASSALPTAVAGTAYSQSFVATGGAAPYSYAVIAGALPGGLTLATDGTLAGTPVSVGTFNITISVTDSTSGTPATLTQAYSLEVTAPALALAPAAGALPTATAGTTYAQTFSGSGGIAPYSYAVTAGSLPTGLTLSTSGELSGVATAAGTYNVTVTVTDSTGGTPTTLSQAYTLTVSVPALTLAPAAGALPSGVAGVAYTATFAADGGIAPYAYTIASGALPAGLTLAADGTLSGTPTVSGNFNVSIRATDSTTGTPAQIVQAYSLQIASPLITVVPTALADATRGTAYTVDFSASGGSGGYTFAISSGTVPAGLTMSAAGNLSGTPTAAGTTTFDVVATDNLGFTGAVTVTLEVIESVPVAVADAATTLAQQPVTVAVTGNDTGVITSITIVQVPTNGTAVVNGLDVVYTPAQGYAGTDTLRYTATGPGGSSQPATVTITVVALPVPVVADQAVTVLAGSAVRIDATAGASGGPFTTVTAVEQPAEGTVVVDGTSLVYTAPATANGTVILRYTLSNAFGPSATATATITVNPLPQAQPQQRDVIAGGSVQVDLTAGATGGPFTAANVIALSPSTAGEVRLEQSGQAWLLTFTPSLEYAGVATVSFTLSNAYATSAQALVSFNVTPRSDPSKDAEVLGMLDAQAATTRRFATSQIGNFQQRLERLHGAGEGGSSFQNGIGFQVDRNCGPGRGTVIGDPCRVPAVSDESVGYSEPLPYTRDTANTSLGLWTGGMISSGAADGRAGREGLDFETSGVSAGADYRVSPSFAIGAGVGYGQDRTDVGDNGTRTDGDAYTLAAYASWHPGRHLFVDWLAGYQLLGFENRRYVTDTGAMVQGKRDGTQWFTSVSAGADFQKDNWQWSPYARLDAARAQLDGYTETGTDSGHALDFHRQDVDTTTVSAGLRVSFAHAVSWGRLSPQLRMEYQRELEDPSTAFMQYADLPGGPLYQADVRGFKRNRFLFGAGLMLAAERDLMVRIEYRGLFGDSEQRDNGLMLNIEKKY